MNRNSESDQEQVALYATRNTTGQIIKGGGSNARLGGSMLLYYVALLVIEEAIVDF